MDFRYYVLAMSLGGASAPPRVYVNKHGYVRVAGAGFEPVTPGLHVADSRTLNTSSQILNYKKSPSTVRECF